MILRTAFTALLALWALSAHAQNVTNPTPPNSVNGAYNASPPTCTDGLGCWLQTDANGNLKVVSSGTPSATQAVTLPTTPTIAAGNGVVPSTSTEAGAAATIASTAALASNLVVKSSAGNLYSFEVAADSTLSGTAWWIMIFDATALPSNGAVTPAKCYAMPSGSTTFSGGFNFPVRFTTGITIGVSTTGCFSLTASVHAFISGDFK